jgi:hypothetical protein
MTKQDQPAGRRPSKLAAALQNAVTRVASGRLRAVRLRRRRRSTFSEKYAKRALTDDSVRNLPKSVFNAFRSRISVQ